MNDPAAIHRQYSTLDPFAIRLDTHARYSERADDLDAACAPLLALTGDESILNVGPGPGRFELYLRALGHRGPLTGLDQSRTMAVEATAALSAAGHAAAWLVGDAQHLPFGDAAFDRIVARHMLYHVPDIPAALREFRRVLRPTGALLVTTNGRANLPGITALIADMLQAFDLPRDPTAPESFVIENAEPALRPAFPTVEARIIENALLFEAAEPIARYVATLIPSLTTDASLASEILAWLDRESRRRLVARGGQWRDPKNVGIFICRTR